MVTGKIEKKSPVKKANSVKTPEKKSLTTTEKPRESGSKSNRKNWNARLEECKEFKEKFGHCKIPTAYKDNYSLGVWTQEQRRNFKLVKQGMKPRGTLSDERIEKLDEIGFHWGFTPDPNLSAESDASWDANFKKLQEYKDSFGTFDVPMESGSSALAKWARVQRFQHNLRKTKRKTHITKERVTQLTQIGFNWDGPRKIDE